MNQKRYITAIIILLALHLLFVNSEIITKLLLHLTKTASFWKNAGALLFALSYSLITVLIIKVYPKVWLFGLTAVFDGFAVFINYNPKPWFTTAAAIYLGIYTSLIILATGFIEKQTNKNQKQNQTKQKLIQELTREIKSLQQANRRLKDENRRQENLNRIKELQTQLLLIQNQN